MSRKNLTIAVDVDGTLIHLTGEKEDTPRYDVIRLFHLLESFGYEMYVWSGGGEDYAQNWVNRLGLSAKVVEKKSFVPDIAIDDEEDNLGKVTLRV